MPARFDLPAFHAAFDEAARAQGLHRVEVATTPAGPVCLWYSPETRADTCPGFISAGMHGDEPAGCWALLDVLREGLPAHRAWVLAPALNPTGLTAGTRENADGIDLNRDFLRQASEEIRGLMAWWLAQPMACGLHLSLHEDWEARGFYLYVLNSAQCPAFDLTVLQALGEHFPLEAAGPVDGHALDAPGLIRHRLEPDEPEGWPEAIWLVKRAPTISYTFEAPGGLPPADRRAGLALALRQALIADAGQAEI